MLQVLPVALQLLHHFEHAARIAGGQRLRHLLQRFERERAEQRAHLGGVELGAAAGDRLIERRERIAHAAFAGLRQHGQRFGVGLDAFLLADPLHALRSAPRNPRERKLKCWQRDAMVAGILCDSVVHSMKTTHSRRLLEVFSSALKASLVIWCASSMMKTL